jgi:hypothetical protein
MTGPNGRLDLKAAVLQRWLAAALLLSLATIAFGTGLTALLDPAVPVFGDLGGHVVATRELQDLLSRGQFRGWSYSWYSGFPLFYFYFPLPALLTLACAALVGLGPAVTAVTLVGPFLIPVAAAVLVRAAGGTRAAALLAAGGSAFFLLARSLGISGGTLESALVGEYSYAIGMALSLFYLATVPRLLEDRGARSMLLPVLLLTATALCHVLTTAMAVAGSLALSRTRRDLLPVVGTWAVAFLISGWWSIPFLGYAAEMSSLEWAAPAPGVVAAWVFEGVPLAILSLFALAWRDHETLDPRLYRVAVVFLATGVAPLFLSEIPIYPGRLLPYAFWAAHVLAGIVVWQSIRALRRRRMVLRSAAVLLGLGTLLGVGLLRVPPWWTADVILRGPEAAGDLESWQHLMAEVRTLEPGAVLSAANFPDPTKEVPIFLLDRYGERQLPALTGHRILGGLWRESSPIGPLSELTAGHLARDMDSGLTPLQGRAPDPDLGVRQARILGARYVVIAGLPEFLSTLDPAGMRLLAQDSLWRLYEIDGAAVAVEPGTLQPVAANDFRAASQRWFDEGGYPSLPVVLDGHYIPPSTGRPAPVAGEADVRLLDGEIRIEGVTPGRPLLLRLSYFPNWLLASPGAGPFRAAPNHILVVPRSDAVRLVWSDGWIEHTAAAASAFGALLMLALGVLAAVGRQAGSTGPEDRSTAARSIPPSRSRVASRVPFVSHHATSEPRPRRPKSPKSQ